MPRQKTYALLRKHRKECNIVRFSGGEPTTHPNILSILAYAKDLKYHIVLLTNGNHMQQVVLVNLVDEYVVNIVDETALSTARMLKFLGLDVSMHVTLVEGNERWITRAVETSLLEKVPLRLLALQKQGRAALNPEYNKSLTLITWTGDKGCSKENKITISWDGKVTTCSALKYKNTCDCTEKDL